MPHNTVSPQRDGTSRGFPNWWRLVSLLLVCSLLAIPALGAMPQRAAVAQAAPDWPATAALVPADAPVYLVASLDPTSAQWQAMQAILMRLGLGTAIEDARDELLREANIAPGSPPGTLFHGMEAAVVVTDADRLLRDGGRAARGGGSGGAVLLRADDIGPWELSATRALELAASAAGMRVTRTVYNGVTILSVPSESQAMARVGDTLVLAEAPHDLQPVIDVYRGDRPSLLTSEGWTALRPALPGEALLLGYADGTAFLGAARAQIAANESLRPFGADLLRLLDGRIAIALTALDDGFRLDALIARRAGSGWPAQPPGAAPALDQQMPADTVLFLTGQDFGRNPLVELATLLFATALVEQVETLPFMPRPTEPADIYDRAAQVLGFNPATDFIDQLTGAFALALTADGLDPNGIDGVFVSQVENPVRVADAVAKLAVLINAGLASSGLGLGLRTKEADGGLIQVLDVPLPDFDTAVHVEFGVVAEQFVVGYGSGLRDYLSGTGGSLAENPRYQAAIQALPAERDWTFYLDVARLVELASEAGAIPVPETVAGQGQPEWSAIESLVAGGYGRGELRGLTVIVRIPVPAVAPGTPVASPIASPAATPVAQGG